MQRLIMNYDNFGRLMGGMRDLFYESYSTRPGYALAITLGRLHDVSYALHRMQTELGSLYREYDGRQSKAGEFASQEQFFQDALAALQTINNRLNEDKFDKYIRAISILKIKIRALEEDLSRKKAENRTLEEKVAGRDAVNARLNNVLDIWKRQASDAAARLDSYEAHVAEILQQLRGERDGLQNRIYELEVEKKSRQAGQERQEAEKSSLADSLQAELDKYKKQLLATNRENASLLTKLRQTQDERDKLRRELELQKRSASQGAQPGTKPEQTPGEKDVSKPQGETERKPEREDKPHPPAPPPPKPQEVEDKGASLLAAFLVNKAPEPVKADKDGLVQRIAKAADIGELLRFLAPFASPKSPASSFMRQLEKCPFKLDKLQAKAASMDDDEYLSADLSQEFFKIISEVVLSNIMSAISRNYDRKPDFYKNLLQLLNKWLANCGVYSRMVWPGLPPSEQDFEDMNFISKTVHDPGRHGIMESVDRLPYYMDYIDEDGERASYHYPGIAVGLKYEKKGERGSK